MSKSMHEEVESRVLQQDDRVLRDVTLRSDADVLLVTLRAALAMNRAIVRALLEDRSFERKGDRTPATATDRVCEEIARQIYEDAFGGAVAFMGEEGGGTFVGEGYCVAVDPIDGTWAFIGDTGMFSTVINVYKDGKPHAGVVAQPTANEMMYAWGSEPTRLLRASRWGMPGMWQTMPQVKDQKSILVNAQWRREDTPLLTALGEAWERREIQQARATGGSPALAMAETAKGSTLYVSYWKYPSSPHDLGGGIKIVENAGGSVIDLDGIPIEPIGHTGVFIAGLRREHQECIREILQRSMVYPLP